jgi:hypothetical protein
MSKRAGFIFTPKNYCLILFSVGLLLAGFLFMTGKGNAGPDHFNSDIYSFRRITLAPLTILAGYILMIYAILAGTRNTKSRNHVHS